MGLAVDEELQATVDSLVEAVRQRDALLSFYWLEQLQPHGRRALSLPDTATGMSALETAVQPFPEFDEATDVLERLRNAHALVIQVLLLAGAEPSAVGAGDLTVWNHVEAGCDPVAVRLLAEWDSGTVEWSNAQVVRSTPAHDLENWLRFEGFDRSVYGVWQDSESPEPEHILAESTFVDADARQGKVKERVVDTDSRSHVDSLIKRLDPAPHPENYSFARHQISSVSTQSSLAFPSARQTPHAYSPSHYSSSTAQPLPLPPLPPPRPMIGIPKKLIPLVESFRTTGYQRIRRTAIGVQVQSALQGRTFKDYTREAERLGIVRLGTGVGFPAGWIALAVCLSDLRPPIATPSPSTAASSPSNQPLLSRIQLEPLHPDYDFHYQVHDAQLFIGKIPDRIVKDELLLRIDLGTLLSPYFNPAEVKSIKVRHSTSAKCRLAFVRFDPRSDVGGFVERAKVLRERGTPLMLDQVPLKFEWNAFYLVEFYRGRSRSPFRDRHRSRSPERRQSRSPDRRLNLDAHAAVQTRAPVAPDPEIEEGEIMDEASPPKIAPG